MNRLLFALMLMSLSSAAMAAPKNPPAVPPVELNRPAPTPIPAQAATPVATQVQSKPTVAPTPAATSEPAPPNVHITLERLTSVRGHRFGRLQPTAADFWEPRLIYDFRIDIPQGWTLMSIDDGRLKRVTDKRGQPVAAKSAVTEKGPLGAPGQAIALELKPDHGVIEFTSNLPPRQDNQLGQVTAAFSLTLGIVKPLHFDNIRALAGRQLLPKDQFRDVLIQLDSVTDDTITVACFGDLPKFGAFTFTDASGAKLEPAAQESTSSPAESGHPAGSLTRYSFIKLPKQISMDVQYFPFRRRAIYNYEQANIPLP